VTIMLHILFLAFQCSPYIHFHHLLQTVASVAKKTKK